MHQDKLKFLEKRSIEIILENQHSSGSFPASPNFSQYKYSWFRDGSYIAYSLLLKGFKGNTRRFLDWGAMVIKRYSYKVEKLPGLLESGHSIKINDFLGARYTLEGEEADTDWPNFQIDGFGSWLWLLAKYLEISGDRSSLEKWRESIEIIYQYLELVWMLPNSDCWEENPDKLHPATLACVSGGLAEISPWIGNKKFKNLSIIIKNFITENRHVEGYYPKYFGSDSIDASLLWLSVPYNVFPPDDPGMKKTVALIETKILEKGGVKRFPEDTYYGGGQWIILSAWLAWYYLRTEQSTKVSGLMEWIVAQMKDDGSLPEQVLTRTNEPSMIDPWEQKWGKVASPLLWSHGMFLILNQEMLVYNNHIRSVKV